jgi:hypothetical protein
MHSFSSKWQSQVQLVAHLVLYSSSPSPGRRRVSLRHLQQQVDEALKHGLLISVPSLNDVLKDPMSASGDYIQWAEPTYRLAQDVKKGAKLKIIRGAAFEDCVASNIGYRLLREDYPLSSVEIPAQENFTWRVQPTYQKRDKAKGERVPRSDVDIVLVGTSKYLVSTPKHSLVVGNFKLAEDELVEPQSAYVEYLKSMDFSEVDAYLLLTCLRVKAVDANRVQRTWQARCILPRFSLSSLPFCRMTDAAIKITVLPLVSFEAELQSTAQGVKITHGVIERSWLVSGLTQLIGARRRVRIQGRKGVGMCTRSQNPISFPFFCQEKHFWCKLRSFSPKIPTTTML